MGSPSLVATSKTPLAEPQVIEAPSLAIHKRNYGLDVIRAVAIGLVVFAHYATAAPVAGVVGVELFFVLSGFLIGGILYATIRKHDQLTLWDVGRFWMRRWMRTLPNYYLFLSLGVMTAALTTGGVDWRTIWRYLVFLQNLAWPPSSFYGVSWSLAVEEWFYLLFPIGFYLGFALAGKRPETRRSIFLANIAFFALLSLGLRLGMGKSVGWSSEMRMVVVYRFDALMFGVILAVVRLESKVWWERIVRLWPIGVILLVTGTIVAHRAFPSNPPLIPAPWLLTILPLGCALILPRVSRWTAPRGRIRDAVNCVSKWSYSIYLCHLPILATLMEEMHDHQQGALGKLLIRATALLLTLTISCLLYRYFERPILGLAPRDRFIPLPVLAVGS